MKIKYHKKDDILVMNFSSRPVEDSFEVSNAILEVDKDKNPVSLEIIHASKFFDLTSKQLPNEVKRRFFSVS